MIPARPAPPGVAATRRQVVAVFVPCLTLLLASTAPAQDAPAPADVRRLAQAAGLASLRTLDVPTPSNLGDFLQPGPDALRTAIVLGKALFWDVQVGSDGQACASCHFHAGADDRTKNQLSPGVRHTDPTRRSVFDPTRAGDGGPNWTLTADDFPFHVVEDFQDRSSPVVHDTDDVASSQGVFAARFDGAARNAPTDAGTAEADPVFAVGGVNVRRVASRNSPSVINAVFNTVNFWDGRAHATFNGVSSGGPLDAAATILLDERGKLVPHAVRIDHASLASQATEPPLSDVEMSYRTRSFAALGRKLLALRPLGQQLIHPKDGILGRYARARVSKGRLTGKPGLSADYLALVKKAFAKKYWSSGKKVDGYKQIEANFSLFFGLSIQLYESTLVSDRTPFDAFMDGRDDALDDVQQLGLLTFVNRGPEVSTDPSFADVFAGNCVACHGGPALTNAATAPMRAPIVVARTIADAGFALTVGSATAFRDEAFSNIGVRPTIEDIGRGGSLSGLPLSFGRQARLALPFAPALPTCGGDCPDAGRTAVDGAFKTPGLRNVELTGPYFHNGGQATLRQVVEFYERQGDFAAENLADLDPELAGVRFVEESEVPLVRFLVGLTDERVRDERAPFDHPQLLVPDGHPGDASALACRNGIQACDALREIPAVGAAGRVAQGLAPLDTFLGIDPLD